MKIVWIIGALLFLPFAQAANIQVAVPGVIEVAHPANTGSRIVDDRGILLIVVVSSCQSHQIFCKER